MTPSTVMATLGRFYEQIYKLPRVGPSLVRGVNRYVAFWSFYSHIVRGKRYRSIADFKKEFLRLVAIMKFPIEIVPGSDTPDRFDLHVSECPFGYCRPDQQGVCDATMEMDRGLFGRMGAELKIMETIPEGATQCRIAMIVKERTGE